MNKKLALLVCFLTVLGIRIQAQEYTPIVGFYIGGNFHNVGITKALYYDDSEPIALTNPETNAVTGYMYREIKNPSVSVGAGLVVGAFYEYMFNDFLGVQAELLGCKNGYHISGNVTQPNTSDTTTYKYYGNVKAISIDLACLLKIHLIEDRLNIDLGVQPSYCLRLTKETKIDQHQSVISYTTDEYSPFNCSAIIGATVFVYDNIFVSARYNFGFIDLLKAKEPYYDEAAEAVAYKYTNTPSATRSLTFSIGYKIM